MTTRTARPAALLLGLVVLAACGLAPERGTERATAPDDRPSPAPSASAPSPPAAPPSEPAPSASSAASGPRPSDGARAEGRLSIAALGIDGLRVVPYRGFTDDAPGTEIQDAGDAASPYGPRGGTGPGGIGNYQVTAHRLSSTRAFEFLPDLVRGDRVAVVADGVRWTYEIRSTRRTSFRDPASLTAQRAAVPGRPGAEPTRAMITLSTCATPEDHAAGNYWSDEFGNPEHRIDKIGVLVARAPA